MEVLCNRRTLRDQTARHQCRRHRMDKGQPLQQSAQFFSDHPDSSSASTRPFRPHQVGLGRQPLVFIGPDNARRRRCLLVGGDRESAFHPVWLLPWRSNGGPYLHRHSVSACFFYSRNRRHWNKAAGYIWLAGILVMGILMHGGYWGCPRWKPPNGAASLLTLLLSLFGLTAAYPLGVILALGRRSRLPAIKSISCRLHRIDSWGSLDQHALHVVGDVSAVFAGRDHGRIRFCGPRWRSSVHGRLYRRGRAGRAAGHPRGQYEAAESLGLDYYQKMRLIILPQALKIVIPPR